MVELLWQANGWLVNTVGQENSNQKHKSQTFPPWIQRYEPALTSNRLLIGCLLMQLDLKIWASSARMWVFLKTFIHTLLENLFQVEDIQKTLLHCLRVQRKTYRGFLGGCLTCFVCNICVNQWANCRRNQNNGSLTFPAGLLTWVCMNALSHYTKEERCHMILRRRLLLLTLY